MDHAIETRDMIPGFSDLSERFGPLKRQWNTVVERMLARVATTDDDELMLWARDISSDVANTALRGPWLYGSERVPTLDSLASGFEASAPLDAVRRKLQKFKKYEHGWDGYAGVPAEDSAVDDALTFLRKIPTIAPLPRPGLAGDGEVGLFWDYAEGFIDIGFLGDGKYSFYGRNKVGQEIFGDDDPLTQEMNEDLRRFIREYE